MKKSLLLLALALVFVPVIVSADFTQSLKYGSKGQTVMDLQDFLADQGTFTGKVDGKFGLATLKAVKGFQSANNLPADGYFGKASRTTANAILASMLTDSDATELSETGTVSTPSTVDGCTDTTLFSAKTGQPCNPATHVSANLPAGCIALSGYSTLTGEKCDGTVKSATDTQAKLDTINSTLNTIANNTTPVVQSPHMPDPIPPVDSTPVEVPFSILGITFTSIPQAWLPGNEIATSISPRLNGINNGDIATLEFNGETIVKTFDGVEKDIKIANKNIHTFGDYTWTITGLEPNTEYPYTIKVQRGNQFGIQAGSFKTLTNN